jgi:hypothetical protein
LLISLLEMWLIKNIKNLCFFSSLVYRQGEWNVYDFACPMKVVSMEKI